MRIIIPMAGMGKRMRPHTLTVPKPLFPIAGRPIVRHLVEGIARTLDTRIEEIAYVIGDFGSETEKQLTAIARSIRGPKQGSNPPKVSIYYQDEPLGTGHAVLCAGDSLKGNVIVAFADTLFRADFKMDRSKDGIIWVHKVENPSSFGVVKINKQNIITDFVEKPEKFVSDLAIIGIYYFRDGLALKEELQYLVDHDIRDKGEYQLTNALENMKRKGVKFVPGKVAEWLDCGNKDATLFTAKRMLEFMKKEDLVAKGVVVENSVILHPSCIGPGTRLVNSVVGPYASVGAKCHLENTVVRESIVQDHTSIKDAVLSNSIIGSHARYAGRPVELNLGDYSSAEE